MEKQGWRVQLGMGKAHGCASKRDRASRLKDNLEKAAVENFRVRRDGRDLEKSPEECQQVGLKSSVWTGKSP